MAEKKKVAVITACCDANGKPVLVLNEVLADENDLALGCHYDRVAQKLRNRGYNQPFVHFDEQDGPAWLFEKKRAEQVFRFEVIKERVARYHMDVDAASEAKAREIADGTPLPSQSMSNESWTAYSVVVAIKSVSKITEDGDGPES